MRISVVGAPIAIMFLAATTAGAAAQTKPVKIGIARSMLVDQPKSIVDIATDDFKAIVKRTIGLDNEILPKFDAADIAARLDKKMLDFGILHGHEYAWAQKKHPDLRPLVVTSSKQPLRVYVIVHKKNVAKSIRDLRGKSLDMPIGTKEPCRVFLAKHCLDKETPSLAKFFSMIANSDSPGNALDNVARGKTDGAVSDAANLEFYKNERGPVFAKNLRVLAESDAFPPAVILYRPGAIAGAVVERFKDGLLKAYNSPEGRDMMKAWNIDGFAEVPKDYDKRLAEVRKAYPAP